MRQKSRAVIARDNTGTVTVEDIWVDPPQHGEVMIKMLYRETTRSIELHSINPAYAPRVVPKTEVEWMARIVWASQ